MRFPLAGIDQIRQILGDATFASGERLAEGGHVTETRELQSGAVVTGVVTEGDKLRVYIQLTAEGIDGECSCELAENCAHVAAVLIHVKRRMDDQSEGFLSRAAEGSLLSTAEGSLSRAAEGSLSSAAFAARNGFTSPQQLLYRLETQLLTNTCINQCVQISLSLWVDQASGQAIPFVQRATHSGFYPRYVKPADKEILRTLLALGAEGPYVLQGRQGVSLLQACLATGRSTWEQFAGQALQAGEAINAELQWHILADGQQQLNFGLSDGNFVCGLLSPAYFINPDMGSVGEIKSTCPPVLLKQLSLRPTLAPEEVSEFNSALGDTKALPAAHELRILDLTVMTLTARLYLSEPEGVAQGELVFVYNGQAVNSHLQGVKQGYLRFMRDGNLYQIQRDFEAEGAFRAQLFGFVSVPGSLALTLPSKRDWLTFMVQGQQTLIRDGWQVEVNEPFPYRLIPAGDWYCDLGVNPQFAETAKAQDWFTLELGIMVEGQPVNILPLLIAQLRNYPLEMLCDTKNLARESLHEQQIDQQLLLQLADGRYLSIPLERVQKILQCLVELCDQDCLNDEGRLTLPRSQASRLAQLARDTFAEDGAGLSWRGEESLKTLAQRLSQFDGIKPLKPPAEFKAKLRGYQQEGLGWLQYLRRFHFGGILADDMGLGKTVQTLAHLLLEKAAGRLQQPALIIAPTSVIGNWASEALRFAPSLKVLTLHGPHRNQLFDQINDADIILTTYPLLNFDQVQLLEHDYYLLVLDEAQNIKNPRAKVSQIVSQINAEHRLCLSGTPVENHLGELWSLFNFLQPGLLGDERSFQRLYRTPIERDGNEVRAQGLAKRVAPFILRRVKEKVATELPAKTEILRQIPMADEQRDLYDSIRLSMHKQIREAIKVHGLARSQIVVLDALLKLRQVCCDPRLLDPHITNGVVQSAKFETLITMLSELVAEGRRILLFSQFTSMLALIEEAVVDLNIPYIKLTGQSKDRAALVERFQNQDAPLFLISLKAGGTGLNLTAADTVIHYDPWWNPAVENQATDRAHRIGQEKPVFIYKLVMTGTVEEKILHLQKRKQGLAEGVYGAKTASPSQLTREDLEHLLAPYEE